MGLLIRVQGQRVQFAESATDAKGEPVLACFGNLPVKLEMVDMRIEILRDLKKYLWMLLRYDLKMDEPRFFSAFRNVLVASSVPIKPLISSSSRPFESDFIFEDRVGKADSSSLETPFCRAYDSRPE